MRDTFKHSRSAEDTEEDTPKQRRQQTLTIRRPRTEDNVSKAARDETAHAKQQSNGRAFPREPAEAGHSAAEGCGGRRARIPSPLSGRQVKHRCSQGRARGQKRRRREGRDQEGQVQEGRKTSGTRTLHRRAGWRFPLESFEAHATAFGRRLAVLRGGLLDTKPAAGAGRTGREPSVLSGPALAPARLRVPGAHGPHSEAWPPPGTAEGQLGHSLCRAGPYCGRRPGFGLVIPPSLPHWPLWTHFSPISGDRDSGSRGH